MEEKLVVFVLGRSISVSHVIQKELGGARTTSQCLMLVYQGKIGRVKKVWQTQSGDQKFSPRIEISGLPDHLIS